MRLCPHDGLVCVGDTFLGLFVCRVVLESGLEWCCSRLREDGKTVRIDFKDDDVVITES